MNATVHRELEDACASRIMHIGETERAEYMRAYAGIPEEGHPYMGGTRTADATSQTLGALAYDMLLKGTGAKGLIRPKGPTSPLDRMVYPGEFARFMVEAGLAGCDKDVIGADSGFIEPMTDLYALAYHALVPNDPNWQASVSSKSIELGGLEARMEATGRGVYATLHNLDRRLVSGTPAEKTPRSVAIEGAGAVGGFAAMFIGEDELKDASEPRRFELDAINDRFATLRVVSDPHSEGMIITEAMVRAICVNPEYATSDKLIELKLAIEQNQPNLTIEHIDSPQALYRGQYGYFIPASNRKHTVNEANIKSVIEMITHGMIEGANDVTHPDVAHFFAENGKTRVPDFIANQQGVRTSMDEIEANMALVEAKLNGTVYVKPTRREALNRIDDAQIGELNVLFEQQAELGKVSKVGLSLADTAKLVRISAIAVRTGLISRDSVPQLIAA